MSIPAFVEAGWNMKSLEILEMLHKLNLMAQFNNMSASQVSNCRMLNIKVLCNDKNYFHNFSKSIHQNLRKYIITAKGIALKFYLLVVVNLILSLKICIRLHNWITES